MPGRQARHDGSREEGPRTRQRRAARTASALGGLVLLVATAGAGFDTYTVQRGDTLSAIAARNRVSVTALAKANGLTNPNRIIAGTRLKVPTSGSAKSQPGGKAKPRYHVVKRGESLSAIASRYGLSVKALARANGIANPNRVMAGNRLTIAKTPAAPAPAQTRKRAKTYKIRSGDTLSAIAARHRVSVRRLAAVNGITNSSRIIAGRTLRIPTGGQAHAAPKKQPATPCPVNGRTRFVNDYGVPKRNSKGKVYRYHEGVDVFAARGAKVVAPVAGTVRQFTGTIGGLQFYLEGDNGNGYFGSHLDSFGASGRVSAGTVLGRVGTSGNARGTSPHLHFQYHPRGGKAANPYPLLVSLCR